MRGVVLGVRLEVALHWADALDVMVQGQVVLVKDDVVRHELQQPAACLQTAMAEFRVVVSVLPIRSDCHLLRANLAYAELLRKILRHVDRGQYNYKHKADGGWSILVRTQKSHSLFLSGFDRASWNRATAFERFSVIVLLALSTFRDD